jgi:beta-lactamase class A
MTKMQTKKDQQESLSENCSSTEKASQGQSSVVNWENLTTIISDDLDFNPPHPNTSEASESREGPVFIEVDDEVDSKGSFWLRKFIKERLEIDAPTPDPPLETNNLPNENGEEITLSLSQTLSEIGDTDIVSTNPTRTSKASSKKKKAQNSSSPESGGNGKSEVALKELVPALETPLNSETDNEVNPIYEAATVPEVEPHRKARRFLTFIPLLMVVTVGAWALKDFTFGHRPNTETQEPSLQSEPTSMPAVVDDNASSSDEIDSTPAALGPVAPQTITSNSSKYDRSVLTQIQKDRLYQASLAYLADDEEDALYVSKSIGYVPNGGHPATMCGPLAMSILRDALLVDRYIDVGDFWLLNPRDDYTIRAILEKYFPREDYQWYQTSIPINYYDFKSHPLYTGDFLYLFAGRGGTFEHMLVVTRVDDEGRAYSVFAREDSKGYSIKEVMLYDPNNSEEGYFYEITDSANAEFGLTGFGGFWMWRRITPLPEVNLDDLAFSDQLDVILNETGGDWHVYIKEIDGRVIYSRKSQEVINPASVIKVPLAIQFFQALGNPEENDILEYLSEHGVKGRTYMQLLRAMLVDSEEDATELLLDWVSARIHVKDTFARWGALDTTYTPRRTTAEEISRIFEGLYEGLWLLPGERQIILDLMSEYSPGDDTRLGLINNYLPDGNNLFNKRGSVAKGFVVVGDVAIIEMGNRAYVVAMFGYPLPEDDLPTYDDLEAAIEEAVPLIWDYLNKQ